MDVERRRRLWHMVTDGAGDRGVQGWTSHLCEVAAIQLNVDGAAISLRFTGRAEELVAASDLWAQRLEELQYMLGEGPGVEASGTAEPVLVNELAADGRCWPGFANAASAVGLAAVFAFPLSGPDFRLGTFDLYRRRTGPLSAEELADAAVLADLITVTLLRDVTSGETAAWAGEGKSGHYDDVHVATGMLAAQLKISFDSAFVRLRARAFSTGQTLLEVARSVHAHELDGAAFQD